jgi:hypothetical protein
MDDWEAIELLPAPLQFLESDPGATGLGKLDQRSDRRRWAPCIPGAAPEYA